MKYAFIAEHRPQYSVRRMCRCLNIQPSGFYAWIKNPLSHRAREDARQIKLLEEAWNDSGKVYGYRKLHDDLVQLGETSCPNRVARLARWAGICAEIGYKRKPGKYGGRPSVVVDNTLDRQFDVTAPDTAWVSDITYIKTYEGFLYLAVIIELVSIRRRPWARRIDQRRLCAAFGLSGFGAHFLARRSKLSRMRPISASSGSNCPPYHSSIWSCSSCLGSAMASRKSA